VIVNALPESYKVDLYGHFGKIGLKGVKIAKGFDAGQAVRIPTGDDRFKATITSRTARPSTASASSRSAGFT